MDKLDGVADETHDDESHGNGLCNFDELYDQSEKKPHQISCTFLIRLGAAIDKVDGVLVETCGNFEEELERVRHGDDLADSRGTLAI